MLHFVTFMLDLKNLKKIIIVKLIKIEMSSLMHVKVQVNNVLMIGQKNTVGNFYLTIFQFKKKPIFKKIDDIAQKPRLHIFLNPACGGCAGGTALQVSQCPRHRLAGTLLQFCDKFGSNCSIIKKIYFINRLH